MFLFCPNRKKPVENSHLNPKSFRNRIFDSKSKPASGMCVILSLFFSIAAVADAATYNGEIEYTAGSGSNEATIVIDFDLDDFFVFTYNWEGEATGWDALSAIDLAGALGVYATDYGPELGVFVSDFDYPGGLEYDYGAGVNTGWAYYVGDNENWSLSSLGVSSRSLSNGGWDSWVWTNYSADWSTAYRTPGAVPVPEPTTIALLGLGGLMLRRRRQ